MSCNCPECDWPVRAYKGTHRITCFRCKNSYSCESTEDMPLLIENESVPEEKWPKWVVMVKRVWQKKSDKGVGDSFEHMAKKIGAKALSEFVKKFGVNCGCRARKAWMNRKYPY